MSDLFGSSDTKSGYAVISDFSRNDLLIHINPLTKFVLYRSAGGKSQFILLSRSTVRDMTHRFYYPQNTKIYIFTFYAFDFLERNVHWSTLSHANNLKQII